MKKAYLTIMSLFIFLPSLVLAHPGRTDSSGCHTCRTNCAKWGLSMGEYHCHRAKTLPQPKEPVKSHFSETGGYTTPAPEYKNPTIAKPKVSTTKTTTTMEINSKIEKINDISVVSKVGEEVVGKKEDNDGWIIKLLKYIFN